MLRGINNKGVDVGVHKEGQQDCNNMDSQGSQRKQCVNNNSREKVVDSHIDCTHSNSKEKVLIIDKQNMGLIKKGSSKWGVE